MQVQGIRQRMSMAGPSSRRWLLAGGFVLLLAGGMWGMATRVQGAEQRGPAYQAGPVVVKTAQASEGPISAELSYTGDVKAVSQVGVLAKATGRIEKLLVDVGSKVKKGDTIAELDSGSLKANVAQAKASLAAAEAKYATMQTGSRAEDIGKAKAAVDAAQAGLDGATAQANIIKRGATDNDIQAAQGAADAAQAALDKAKADQATVQAGPTQTQWWQALGALDAARANMKSAEAKLADVKAGPKQADIQAAEALVEAKRSALYAADDRKGWAADSLPGDAYKWGSAITSSGQAGRAADAALADYNAAVEALNLLKSRPLPADLAAAQSGYDAAKASYDQWSNAVDEMKRGVKSEDLSRAQAGVDAAQANLASAQAKLKTLKDGPTEDDAKRADAAVAQAQAGLDQANQLYSLVQKPYTKNDLDAAKASVAGAQAAVELAQIGLSEAVVVSPVDGVISDRLVSQGALVSPQTPIVSLVSSEVELVLGVEESQIGQVAEGQKAGIEVAAYPGTVFGAKVAVIAPVADPKSRTFVVKVRPDANEGKLKAGMFAQVKLVTGEKEKAVLVPREAVVTKGGQSVVYVLKGDAVQQRPVKVGLSKGGSVEIVNGVDAGEEVVVAGQNDLRDGDKVKKS